MKKPEAPRTPIRPAQPHVSAEGVPGFHPPRPTDEALPDATGETSGTGGDAGQLLDTDTKGRVNTGTGDQPGNTKGARTGTPPPDEDR